MVLFINETGTIGVIYNAVTNNITGSEFLTLLGLILIILLLFLTFRVPIEISAIIILPMLLIFMAFNNSIWAAGGLLLIYLGVLFFKNFFIN
jgi:predicted RND superfamily exporter protein